MTPGTVGLAFLAGLLVALVTAPVGVSGAVFLLPVQLDVLRVPSPAVTPTNLLFNVVATPAAVLRYHRSGSIDRELTRRLLAGTLPGVVVGTAVRVFLAPGDQAFRLLAAAVLLPIGLRLCLARAAPARPRPVGGAATTALGVGVGIVGGVYGIGGGSLIGPILVGGGLAVARVAPAALVTTLVTSVAGIVSYGLLALVEDGPIAPDWAVGLLCGAGGVVGAHFGARLQPHLPERALRLLLGTIAVALAAGYVVNVVARAW